jgi:hypothetical protein
MNLETFLEYTQNKFNINKSLYATVERYFSRVWKNYPEKIECIEKENISMLTNDELVVDWFFKKGYFQIRIKEKDIRCEAKFKDGIRFGKYHHLPEKMIEALSQSINRLKAEEIDG